MCVFLFVLLLVWLCFLRGLKNLEKNVFGNNLNDGGNYFCDWVDGYLELKGI